MNALDLSATYTVTYPGNTEPTTITPTVRTKTRPDGVTLTIVKGLTPLLADHIDAITDEGDRMHALNVLGGATIFISDTPDDEVDDSEHSGSYYRDRGTLSTTYYGARGLPVSAVLDLAEQLRTQLTGNAFGEPEDRWVWLIADFSPFPDAPNATVTDDPEVGSTRDAARNAALHMLSTAPSASDPNSPASATIRAWREDPSLNHVWIHRTVAMAVFPYGGEHGSLEEAAQSIVRKLGKEYAPRYAEEALVVEGQPLTPTQERWRRFIEANDAQQ